MDTDSDMPSPVLTSHVQLYSSATLNTLYDDGTISPPHTEQLESATNTSPRRGGGCRGMIDYWL